jgi:starch synthase
MKILFVSPEVAPLSKTGGLGDVSGALPRALAAQGAQVTVVTPRYRCVDPGKFSLARRLRTLTVSGGREMVEVGVYEGHLPGGQVGLMAIDYPPYFDRERLYAPPEPSEAKEYPDNAARFALLCRAALEVARLLGPWPDIVHVHDWQAGLIPLLLARSGWPQAATTGSVLTIHNLAFQGLFPPGTMDEVGLPWDLYHPEGIEFWNQVSFLKAGILFADRVTTVSPTYSREIQTAEFGCGLDGLLRSRQAKLAGILNGVDYGDWSPASDPLIARRFDASNREGKVACKAALQGKVGLPQRADVPLIGAISRLTDQKGFDLVVEAAEELAGQELQLVILGSGEPAIQGRLEELARRHPTRFAVRIAYDNTLAHEIEAGSDLYLMPSRFEPCGLNQMYSLRYGTLPIVRAVGGLEDTIVDYDPVTRTGNGFKFSEYTSEALLGTLRRALRLYADRAAWDEVSLRAMQQDFSWSRSASHYLELFEAILRQRRP